MICYGKYYPQCAEGNTVGICTPMLLQRFDLLFGLLYRGIYIRNFLKYPDFRQQIPQYTEMRVYGRKFPGNTPEKHVHTGYF